MNCMIPAYCRCCRQAVEIFVNVDDYNQWQNGKLIQDAFPYLSVDEREILISGTCGPCFDAMFSEEE